MFYEEKELHDIQICPQCRQTFNDPRILPCGQTICFECISIQGDKNEFTCCCCEEKHTVPDKGFIKNEAISRLVKKRPHEIYRGRKIEEFESLLRRLSNYESDIEDCINNSEYKLKEFFKFKKYDIDIVYESKVLELEKSREKLMGEVDQYENECLKALSDNKSHYDDIQDLLKEVMEQKEKFQSIMKKTDLNENNLDKSGFDLKAYLNNISRKIAEYNRKLFNNKNLEFFPVDNASEKLGSINYNLFSGYINISSLKALNIRSLLGISETILSVDATVTHLVIITTYKRQNEMFNMSYFFDYEGKLVTKVKTNSLEVIYNKWFSLKNDIFFATTFKKPDKKTVSVIAKQKSVGSNINTACFTYITIHDENVFLLTKDSIILVYDSELKQIASFGQHTDQNSEYYIPTETKAIEVSDKHLFLFSPTNVRIINRIDGTLFNSFQATANLFGVDNDKIITYNKQNKMLFYYNFNGEKEYEQLMSKFEPELMIIKNNFFLFMDKDKIYISA